ncbi:MAG TPA: hypothetical protein VIY49_39545 [Bryobacteraceae bacterium]
MTFEELSALRQSAITQSLQDRDTIRNMTTHGLGDRERLRALETLAREDGEHIRALLRIAEIHERRLSRLEGEE